MRISIIIPVYNSEKYLSTTIESVINQTYNFKESIQLILVDDGSNDNSYSICDEYRKKYSTNINLIKIENGGPARARNVGLKHVHPATEVIGFLDADDYFKNNMVEKMADFFSENQNIPFAVPPITLFGDVSQEHNLNYRFKNGTRIVDIEKEYNSIHFYIGGTFIQKKYFTKYNLSFFENMKFFEDALFLNKLLIHEKQYGVVADTLYYYRKENEQALSLNSWKEKSRYTLLLQYGYLPLIRESEVVHGCTIPYIQYLISYHMRLFLFQRHLKAYKQIITEVEHQDFIETMHMVLQCIDEKYLLEQNTKYYIIEMLLSIKNYGWPIKFNKRRPQLNNWDVEIVPKVKSDNNHNLRIEITYQSDKLALKEGEYFFIKTLFGRKNLASKPTNKKIKIWGVTVRDYKYSIFTGTVGPRYCVGQYGLHMEQGDILLSKYNYLPHLLRNFRDRIVKRTN